jgi:hypothetical protein
MGGFDYMTITNEQLLAEEVENFFNEEDTSVGIYAIGMINNTVVKEFVEAFEGAVVTSFEREEMEFKFEGSTYKVILSPTKEQWVLTKYIRL